MGSAAMDCRAVVVASAIHDAARKGTLIATRLGGVPGNHVRVAVRARGAKVQFETVQLLAQGVASGSCAGEQVAFFEFEAVSSEVGGAAVRESFSVDAYA